LSQVIRLQVTKIRFICETQILKVKRIKIWKSNNPAKDGGFNTP
jgi:hypothetical protein